MNGRLLQEFAKRNKARQEAKDAAKRATPPAPAPAEKDEPDTLHPGFRRLRDLVRGRKSWKQ